MDYLRYDVLRQMFPPKATFTGENLPDLTGKVYIVTGANAGVGHELTRLLYAAGGTVYMLCRTKTTALKAKEHIEALVSASATAVKPGRLEFIPLDLADLNSVAPAVAAFRAKEKQLHVLFNNAGVMLPTESWGPEAQRTKQDYDLQLGTNCVGPFLLTQLLTPVLAATAADPATATATAPGSVRVVWVASVATEVFAGAQGLDVATLIPAGATPTHDNGGYLEPPTAGITRYGRSKAGNYLHAVGYAQRHGAGRDNIVSIALNPGNLDSDLYRSVGGKGGNPEADRHKESPGLLKAAFAALSRCSLYPPVFGAYTELWAGFSPDVTLAKASEGAWVAPWGRFSPMRPSILKYALPESAGGGGGGEAFYDWAMAQVKPYLQG